MGGAAFCEAVREMGIAEREELALGELINGNTPSHARSFAPVEVKDPRTQKTGTIWVARDYLTIGSDYDAMRVPLTPITAQRAADAFHCVLPTAKMVDDIYRASSRQAAIPIGPPSKAMMTVAWFYDHQLKIEAARRGALGDLVAGHKKDVVVTKRLRERPPKVAIYGFYLPTGRPIQALMLPHEDTYVDYSHGIRLVYSVMEIDGQEVSVADVLKDPSRAGLLSGEGAIPEPRYAIRPF